MSEIKEYMTSLFVKYNIFNRRQFLSVFIYTLRSILNETINFENEYQYCVAFYLTYLQSVAYDSVPTNLLIKLFESQRDPNATVDDSLSNAPTIEFGVLCDKLFVLLSSRSIKMSDFEDLTGFTITSSPQLFTLNGVSSPTVRGCVWKLLYTNLRYKLENMI